jgi:hypothetical protein
MKSIGKRIMSPVILQHLKNKEKKERRKNNKINLKNVCEYCIPNLSYTILYNFYRHISTPVQFYIWHLLWILSARG